VCLTLEAMEVRQFKSTLVQRRGWSSEYLRDAIANNWQTLVLMWGSPEQPKKVRARATYCLDTIQKNESCNRGSEQKRHSVCGLPVQKKTFRSTQHKRGGGEGGVPWQTGTEKNIAGGIGRRKDSKF